jgi:hypothetical protein
MTKVDLLFKDDYGRMVCTKTGETVSYIARTRRHEFSDHIAQSKEYNFMVNFMSSIFTYHEADVSEVENAIAFDLFPVFYAKDLAVVAIGPIPGIMPEEGVRFYELNDD